MIASSVPVPRWLLVLLISALGMTAWQARPAIEGALAAQPDAGAVEPVAYRYVPLLGSPLAYAVEDARGDLFEPPVRDPSAPVQTCLPFLAPLLAHPNWQIRIARGSSNCSEDRLQADFTISSTGAVTWTQRSGWPVRRLQLSPEQLALVQRIDRLSCVAWKDVPAQYLRSHWLVIGVDFISQGRGIDGALIPLESDLGQALAPMLEQLVDEYLEPRRALVDSMDLRLATTVDGAVYRVRIAGGRLTVSRGRRLLVEEAVGSDTAIDLVDAALERRAVAKPDLKGTLQMNGWSVPVAVARGAEGPYEQIDNAIRGAIERAQEAE